MVEHGQNERASVLDTVALLTNVPSERLVSSNSWNEEQRCPGGVRAAINQRSAMRIRFAIAFLTLMVLTFAARGQDTRARSPLSNDQVRRVLMLALDNISRLRCDNEQPCAPRPIRRSRLPRPERSCSAAFSAGSGNIVASTGTSRTSSP